MKFHLQFFIILLASMVYAAFVSAKDRATALDLIRPEIPFCANAKDFNVNNAYWLAIASDMAYQEQGELAAYQHAFPNMNFKLFHVKTKANKDNDFVAVSAEVLLIEGPSDVIIAVRGTDPTDSRDVLADLSVRKVKWAGPGKIHIGFLRFFEALWTQLSPALKEIQNKQVWITGHSLGGAGATLIFAHLLQQQQQWTNIVLKDLYTLGVPRVGSATFASWIEKNRGSHGIYRIRNHNDPISMAPATHPIPFGLYHHVGELIYIDGQNRIIRNANEKDIGLDWIDIDVDDFWSNISDHYNRKYVEVLMSQDLQTQCPP